MADDKVDSLKEYAVDVAAHGSSQHAEDLAADREPYGPPGLQGLIYNPFVLMCAICSTLGGFIFGYDQGVVSVILVMEQFLDTFPRVGGAGSGFWKGLLTAMIELGALIGALNQGWIADKISRRYSILVAVAVFTIGSILQTAAVEYGMLTFARFVGGLGVGMLSMVAPLYIAEISPSECRGTLLVLQEWSIIFGIVIAYWITYGTRYMAGEWSWRLPFLLQMVPGFILAAGVIFLPFSPRWLASKGRNEEALKTLSRLRKLPTTDRRVRQEYMDILAEVRFHRETNAERHPNLQGGGAKNGILLEIASFADCFRRGYWRRTHIGIMIPFFQQFVGINALIYYSPTLFETMGFDMNIQLIMSGVLNCLQLVGCSTTIWTMDTVGRRKLLLGGSAAMSISHIVIAVLVGLFSSNWAAHQTEGWVSAAFLLVYMIAFGAAWGPVGWAIPSEIFPSSLRAKGVALATCSNWLNNFIIGLITPPLIEDTGYGAYVFFAVFCIMSGIWTFFFVPETMGRSLEDMDAVFKDNSSERERERRRAIERELLRERVEGGV
ncbi:sugar porter family MFS transporter [Aspergillus stella-maris]|uniref:sugar porter family MFS transporter n=1 Tax=Aspergillus stella-maris TaxID=1810926 RepID=UPI003CCE13AD